MMLVKSCEKKFNIKNGTLKIGTLRDYQTTEKEEIADQEEGLLRFNINIEGPVTVSNTWANTLFGKTMSFGNGDYFSFSGGCKVLVKKIHQVETTETHTTFKDSSASITRNTLNCFIFCMSELADLKEAIGIFPKYDDDWSIPLERAEEFGLALAVLLREKLHESRLKGKHIIPEDISIENLHIRIEQGKIGYYSRNINITSSNTTPLKELYNRLEHIDFTKPPEPFQKEHEYRFKFILISDGKIIPPLVDYIIIDSSKLFHFIV
ncbi:hypothetical protein [Pseudomonas sp. JQ36]